MNTKDDWSQMKGRSDVLRDWAAELEAWREQFENDISRGAVWADQFETWPLLIVANGLKRMADSMDPNKLPPEHPGGDCGAVIFDRRDNDQRFVAAHVGPDRRGGES